MRTCWPPRWRRSCPFLRAPALLMNAGVVERRRGRVLRSSRTASAPRSPASPRRWTPSAWRSRPPLGSTCRRPPRRSTPGASVRSATCGRPSTAASRSRRRPARRRAAGRASSPTTRHSVCVRGSSWPSSWRAGARLPVAAGALSTLRPAATGADRAGRSTTSASPAWTAAALDRFLDTGIDEPMPDGNDARTQGHAARTLMIVDAHNDLLVEVDPFPPRGASVPRPLARPAASRRRGAAGVPGVRGRDRAAGVGPATQPHADRRVSPGGGRRPRRRAPGARRARPRDGAGRRPPRPAAVHGGRRAARLRSRPSSTCSGCSACACSRSPGTVGTLSPTGSARPPTAGLSALGTRAGRPARPTGAWSSTWRTRPRRRSSRCSSAPRTRPSS